MNEKMKDDLFYFALQGLLVVLSLGVCGVLFWIGLDFMRRVSL